jgi:hypothetical protein
LFFDFLTAGSAAAAGAAAGAGAGAAAGLAAAAAAGAAGAAGAAAGVAVFAGVAAVWANAAKPAVINREQIKAFFNMGGYSRYKAKAPKLFYINDPSLRIERDPLNAVKYAQNRCKIIISYSKNQMKSKLDSIAA